MRWCFICKHCKFHILLQCCVNTYYIDNTWFLVPDASIFCDVVFQVKIIYNRDTSSLLAWLVLNCLKDFFLEFSFYVSLYGFNYGQISVCSWIPFYSCSLLPFFFYRIFDKYLPCFWNIVFINIHFHGFYVLFERPTLIICTMSTLLIRL